MKFYHLGFGIAVLSFLAIADSEAALKCWQDKTEGDGGNTKDKDAFKSASCGADIKKCYKAELGDKEWRGCGDALKIKKDGVVKTIQTADIPEAGKCFEKTLMDTDGKSLGTDKYTVCTCDKENCNANKISESGATAFGATSFMVMALSSLLVYSFQ